MNQHFNKKSRQQRHIEQFIGSFVYYIRHKQSQQIVYVGQSSNFVQRYVAHFDNSTSYKNNSKFHNWCIEHGYEKQDFEFIVLDITNYDTIDTDDRFIIEKALQLFHGTSIINSPRKSLNAYEQERFEQLTSIIEFEFVSYTELKQQYIQKNKRLTSRQTK